MSKVYYFLRDIDTSQLAQNKRECWMPKGDLSYYDPVAQRTFQSRAEKRAWLTTHGMRETGELIRPDKFQGCERVSGREKTRLSPERQRIHQATLQHIQSLGGVNGLLDHLERKRHVG